MNYISLGYFCSVALELEKYGLRKESSPFDWLITEFEGVITLIENHFKDFLAYEYLAQNKEDRLFYMNTKYRAKFVHDFDKYKPLAPQLPEVQKKFERRIERFYKTIAEPTLFIRYISDEKMVDGVSEELIWIENNYDYILRVLKMFNEENDIMFIANDGVVSEKIKIYHVAKDENDNVARSPFDKNEELSEMFSQIDTPEKGINLEIYAQKQKRKNNIVGKVQRGIVFYLKKIFLKEYIHEKEYYEPRSQNKIKKLPRHVS